MPVIGQSERAAGFDPQRAAVGEVRDVVRDLGKCARGFGAPVTQESQTVDGLQGCPQGALMFSESARERQEFGLNAWTTS